MKVDLFLMPTVPATFEERQRERPVGRSRERYQMMIEEMREIAVMADEMGYDAFSTTEHHLHTEGGEAMPNPVLMYADLAARTRNIHFIPMSVVLTASNPIRVAEDIALLDHLTGGRTGVCLARGYQKAGSRSSPRACRPRTWVETRRTGSGSPNTRRSC